MGPILPITTDTRLRRGVIAGLICVFLAINLAVPKMFEDPGSYWLGLTAGVCIAELNLIATWAALATGNVMFRLPWSLLLGVLVWYSLILGIRMFARGSFDLSEATLLGIVLLTGVVFAQIPLWIAGKVFRWKLISGTFTGDGHQFNLRHLLTGMFLLSLALGTGRVVLPAGNFWNVRMDDELWAILGAVIFCNLVIAVPCIWGSFARTNWLLPLSLGWLVYCALLTAIEFGFLCAVLGPPGTDWADVAFAFYLLNVTQCGVVFGVLLLLRALGFRFVQLPG